MYRKQNYLIFLAMTFGLVLTLTLPAAGAADFYADTILYNGKIITEGIMLGGGSDAPVVNYDPFLSLWWMVTRNTVTAGTLGADQKITREEAIRLYTIGSAYFTFEEDTRGSIEPGKLADLVILDNDILKCPADDIKNIRPLKTMMGGEFVFEAK